MFKYSEYDLTIDLNDIDNVYRNGSNKIFALVLFVKKENISLYNAAKLSGGTSAPALCRFIHNGQLKEICPKLYEDCIELINVHKKISYNKKKLMEVIL